MSRFSNALVLAVLCLLAVLAPVSATRDGSLGVSAAECETCCPQRSAYCVICGGDECVVHPGYYQGKIGPGGCQQEEIT